MEGKKNEGKSFCRQRRKEKRRKIFLQAETERKTKEYLSAGRDGKKNGGKSFYGQRRKEKRRKIFPQAETERKTKENLSTGRDGKKNAGISFCRQRWKEKRRKIFPQTGMSSGGAFDVKLFCNRSCYKILYRFSLDVFAEAPLLYISHPCPETLCLGLLATISLQKF